MDSNTPQSNTAKVLQEYEVVCYEMTPAILTNQQQLIKTKESDISKTENPYEGKFHSLHDVFLMKCAIVEWLITGFIAMMQVVVLWGAPGTGKTFVILDLLMALAFGVPEWAGFSVPKARNVLYCAGEGVFGLRKRLYGLYARYREKYNIEIPPGSFDIVECVPLLFNKEHVEAFIKSIIEYAKGKLYDVIVIDTLSLAALGAEENSNTDMAQLLGYVAYIAQQLNTSIILIHHANKTDGYRGAVAIKGNVDCMFKVSLAPGGNIGILQCDKLRDGKPFDERRYRLVSIDSPFDPEGTAVVEWLPQHMLSLNGLSQAQRGLFAMKSSPDKVWTAKELCVEMQCREGHVKQRLEGVAEIEVYCANSTKPASKVNPFLFRLKQKDT